MTLNIAFVGMGRDPRTLPKNYLYNFIRYHLELPYYYQRYADINVSLTFNHELDDYLEDQEDCERLFLYTEREFSALKEHFDVVIHWRKWNEQCYREEAVNLILSQDHSYGNEWKKNVWFARDQGKLTGILVFPEWHKKNTDRELEGRVPLFEGVTLGVDTEIFYPGDRDPYKLLWASDPGRGLQELIPVFLELRRYASYQLFITWPDYVQKESLVRYNSFFKLPGVNVIGQIPNDENLWKLFRDCGTLPYTSTFPEPSSRCHRQAMACGALVLYPENMGTPSDLLSKSGAGVVANPSTWAQKIYNLHKDDSWYSIANKAVDIAVSENWEVQAKRFYDLAVHLIGR